MAGAGEPAQHPSAHLLLHRGEVFGCGRLGLSEVGLPVFAGREHPVDPTAIKGHIRIQCGPEARHNADRAPPPERSRFGTGTLRKTRGNLQAEAADIEESALSQTGAVSVACTAPTTTLSL